MNPRDKIPKHLPCHTCLVVVMCIGVSINHLFETCQILKDWFDERETM